MKKIKTEEMATSRRHPEAQAALNLKGVLNVLATPMECRFTLGGQSVCLQVRRAMGDVTEQCRAILRGPQPPYVKERQDYDMLAPAYLERRDAAMRQARALTVYACCPEVASILTERGLSPTADAVAITAALKTVLPDNIQELIEMTALAGGLDVEVEKRANFISPAPLES